MTASEVLVRAPAKVNLVLGVGPVRADGYHPLATVYQAIGVYDDVRVRPGRDRDDTLAVTGAGVDASSVPTDTANLVLRAARLLREQHRLGADRVVDATVVKRIPVAGGLAGGSTDAAAALVACAALWELRTPRSELLELAGRLGSDVPFCLLGGTAMGSGRGEQVTALTTTGSYWWVVMPAAGGLSTPAVYAEFDRLAGGIPVAAPVVGDEMVDALRVGDVKRIGAALHNDLEPAALSLRPDLAAVVAAGRAASYGSIVTGSGPTTVHLCESRAHAEEVERALRETAGTGAGWLVPADVGGAEVVEVHR